MHYLKYTLLLLLVTFTFLYPANTDFIKGADVSFIPQIEDNGGIYRQNDTIADPLQIFKDHGINYIRLKIWHTPAVDYNNLAKILYMAERIKNMDLKFLLDFHYSDTWADPSHQQKPAAWQNLSFEQLKDSVYSYTKNVFAKLNDQGTLPDMVQIGNEINSGMLWNDGRVGGDYNGQWPDLAALINEGVRGVRESCEDGDSVKIVIHYAGGGNNSGCRWFYDNLTSYGAEFDIIGLSYYPWWHGTLSQVRSNLNDLAGRYGKDIIIAETAYPWTLQWYDSKNNIVGSTDQLHDGYSASVRGQGSFLRDLMSLVRQVKNGRGTGIFYWAPEYISVPGVLSSWENNALFDFDGDALESMNVFEETPDSLSPINVQMLLNTATNWDTLQTWHFAQIRGEVEGNSYINLPDGKKVTWDSDCDLIMENVGGDYWSVTFQMYRGDKLSYKFWTGYSRDKGTYQRLGWEGPVHPSPESSENMRIFTAGQNDTTVEIQYYNSMADVQLQDWQLLEKKPDSIAVFFRVNMAGAMNSGRFDPDVNGPVGVRGDAVVSGGELDWQLTKLILQREQYSIFNGSFWSGKLYIPAEGLDPGQTLKYKFFIENDSGNGWENNVEDREFLLTPGLINGSSDTTLHWVYFDDLSLIDDITAKNIIQPNKFVLYQNFPNPFNSQTSIRFTLPKAGIIRLNIYDINGRIVNTLLNRFMTKGEHELIWSGTDNNNQTLATGIYLMQLECGGSSSVRKIILMK
jgi:arabinogalactan endo-1,4-beta-galactosidase